MIVVGSANVVPGRTLRSSSAAAIVTTLNVEPGSKVSVTGRLRSSSGLIFARSLGLKRGTVAMAMMAPVRGSMTMPVALLASYVARVAGQGALHPVLDGRVDRELHVLAGDRLAVLQHLDRVAEAGRAPPPGARASP